MGLLDDARLVFAESDHVEWAGSFLAIAMLSKSAFFDHVRKVCISVDPSFYGSRSVMMSLLLMAVLRITNPERLNRRHPEKLGRILGLDRAPAVKTLRRKIKILAARNKTIKSLRKRIGRALVTEYEKHTAPENMASSASLESLSATKADELIAIEAHYPGTHLRMEFETNLNVRKRI